MITDALSNQKRILLLLWHPDTIALNSGGFIRIKEFLKETPNDFIIDTLDNYPTIFKNGEVTGQSYYYRIPNFIVFIEKRIFLLGRLLEGIVTFFGLVIRGFSLNKNKKYRVIYSPTAETFTTFAAIVLSRFFKVKVVLDSLNIEMSGGNWRNYYKQLRQARYSMLHATLLPGYIYLVHPILIRCFNRADCIVTVSPYLMKKLKELGVKEPMIDYTPSGVNYDYFARIPQQKKIYDAIFIGRHEIAKGIFDLINAWRIVINSYPEAKLLMVGYCDTATKRILMQKIKEYNLQGNILLAGGLSEEDKAKSIKQSKIYIHLSPMEPLFPVISILEGLVCGLPLVSYDAPAYKEIEEIHYHKAISLVPAGDVEKAASEIIRYLRTGDPEKEKISKAAQEYAMRFDWKQIAARQFSIIRNVSQMDV